MKKKKKKEKKEKTEKKEKEKKEEGQEAPYNWLTPDHPPLAAFTRNNIPQPSPQKNQPTLAMSTPYFPPTEPCC